MNIEMNIEINKVKLSIFKSLKVGFTELDKNNIEVGTHETVYSAPAHPDLLDMFKLLIPHFLSLTELKSKKDLHQVMTFDTDKQLAYINNSLSKFHVSAVSESGKDEAEGIVITGQCSLDNGKVYNVNSPFYTWNELEESEYGVELKEVYDNLLKETELYIGGKVDKAPSLFDSEESESDREVSEMIKENLELVEGEKIEVKSKSKKSKGGKK